METETETSLPENLPEVNLPEVNLPEVNLPEDNLPEVNLPEDQALITASSQSPAPCSARNPRQLSDWVRRNRTTAKAASNRFRRTRKPKKVQGKPTGASRTASKALAGQEALPPPTPYQNNQSTSLLEAKKATPWLEVIPAGGLSLFEVEPRHCRWPVNPQHEEYRCCGAPRVLPYPYCQEHVRRAFNFNARASSAFATSRTYPKSVSTKGFV